MNYSTSNRADLQWIRLLLYSTVITYLVAIVGDIFHYTIGTRMRPALLSLVLFFLINAVGLKGIRKNAIFVIRVLPDASKKNATENDKIDDRIDDKIDERNLPGKTNKSYHNYGLKPAEAQLLAEKLKEYMNLKKPHMNPDLCLKDLAEQLNVYPHYVTQILNTLFNQNFYDFVNTYRVNEAKKLLKEGVDKSNKVPVITIAYDCGFNSKSSFNRIFKQKIGITPSEYREKNAKNSHTIDTL
jgi:AraC-like DNA-binding protein